MSRTRTGRSSFQTIADMTQNIILKSILVNGSYNFDRTRKTHYSSHYLRMLFFFFSFFFGFLNENQTQPSHIDHCLRFRQNHEFIAAQRNRSTSCIQKKSIFLKIVLTLATWLTLLRRECKDRYSFSWLFFCADNPLILNDVISGENKYFLF